MGDKERKRKGIYWKRGDEPLAWCIHPPHSDTRSIMYNEGHIASYGICLISWINTTRVLSPDHPRLLLEVTINRAARSITGKK